MENENNKTPDAPIHFNLSEILKAQFNYIDILKRELIALQERVTKLEVNTALPKEEME